MTLPNFVRRPWPYESGSGAAGRGVVPSASTHVALFNPHAPAVNCWQRPIAFAPSDAEPSIARPESQPPCIPMPRQFGVMHIIAVPVVAVLVPNPVPVVAAVVVAPFVPVPVPIVPVDAFAEPPLPPPPNPARVG